MKWLSYLIWLLPISNLFAQTCGDGSAPVVQSAVIGGMKSWDAQGDSDNESILLCGFPANGNIIGGEHSGIDISPKFNSYCNEARFRLNNAVTLTPAVGENNTGPCINNYSGGGSSNLQDNGLVFQADGAGCVTIESFESYDDISNFVDADITAGVITLYACPEGVLLPIELKYFRAVPEDKTNNITWATSSELNTEWHIVERSATGTGNWEKMGQIEGAGTSNENHIY
ncbi:MAG TPA: hypothetical protein ENJ95_09135, partial [Bacteroidetes bacterium]|nr:hypothetical protein [Bacteroidota bacterium]